MAKCDQLPRRRAVLPVVHSAALVATLLAGTSAWAVQPRLNEIAPVGMAMGQRMECEFRGERLGSTKQVLLYEPGLTVVELTPIDDARVKAVLEASADCRTGLHAVRLVTSAGISNLRLVSVGPYAAVDEVEPNSDFAAPQRIDLNTTIQGTIENEDQDYFAVQLTAGQTLAVEIEGLRLWSGIDGNFFDPYIAILNPQRFEQAVSDDSSLLRQDGLICFQAPVDGTYIILARESSFGGSASCKYRLHVGLGPRPVAVYPAGGQPGELLNATLIDPLGRTWSQQFQLPDHEAEVWPVIGRDEHGVAASPVWLRVNRLPSFVEAEPNNQATPTKAGLPGAMHGVISAAGDHDWFAFDGKAGQRIEAQLYARRVLRSPLDSVVEILKPDGSYLAGSDDSAGPDSVIEVDLPVDGTYLVRVRDQLDKGQADSQYRLEIRPIEPMLSLSLPERRQNEEVTLAIPRGARMAAVMNIARRNVGEALQVTADHLPAGVRLVDNQVAANAGSLALVMEAAPDAPLGGSLVGLQATPVAEASPIVGILHHRAKLVLGQNFVDVWGNDDHRLAVAVVDALPVTAEVEPPAVPLVQMGQIGLKLRVNRQESFQQPIYAGLLSAPPGVSAPAAIEIPAGQSEGVIPLTAAANAAVGVWPIVVMVWTPHGGATAEWAVGPVPLEVAGPAFNFAFQKTMAEQGRPAEVVVNMEVLRPFDGSAEVELLGVPAGVTCPTTIQQVTKESTQLVFPIQVAPDARVGSLGTFVVQARIPMTVDRIVQTQGTGELQIDAPLLAAAPPAATPEPVAPEATAPATKRLTRLEQLRANRQNPAATGQGDSSP
jgi:hypothetical protein